MSGYMLDPTRASAVNPTGLDPAVIAVACAIALQDECGSAVILRFTGCERLHAMPFDSWLTTQLAPHSVVAQVAREETTAANGRSTTRLAVVAMRYAPGCGVVS